MRTLVAIALMLTLAAAHGEDSRYGFVQAPGTYDSEYRECAWPDEGSGKRYHPGYAEDRARCYGWDDGAEP
jgi:hypothetical protein